MKTKKLLLLLLIIAATAGIIGFLVIPAFFRLREESRKDTCFGNLKQIGLAMDIYANDHEDKFPPTLKDLMPKYVTDKVLLHCPSDRSDKLSYLYVPGLTPNDRPTVMVVIDRAGIHQGGRNVLFVDTHLAWLNEPEFQTRWAKQREELKLPSLKELGDTVEEKPAAPAASTKEKE